MNKLWIAAICLVSSLSMIVFYQHERIRTITYERDVLNAQIDNLKNQSVITSNRIEDARRRAEAQMKQIEEDTKLILAADVPKDCVTAMAWGIERANDF